MNTRYTETFYNSFQSVMPQLGIENIGLKDVSDTGNQIHSPRLSVLSELWATCAGTSSMR